MNLSDDPRARLAYREAIRLRALGDHEGALRLLVPLIVSHPESPKLLGTIGSLLFLLDRLRDAWPYFQRVLALRPNNEIASLGLFHCLWDIGDRDGARRELVRFLSQNESQEYSQLLQEMGWHFDRAQRTLIER